MENKTSKKVKAFTLTETIVYLALFGILFVMILEFAIFIRQANTNANNATSLDNAVMFIVQKLDETFEEANDVDSLESTFNTAQSTLAIDLNNGEDLSFYIFQNRLVFERDSISNYISPLESIISTFNVQPIYTSDLSLSTIIGVSVNIEISIDSGSEALTSRNITTQFYL